jgi:hypothetical protein
LSEIGHVEMKISEITRPNFVSQINEIIEFDEIQYGLEMLYDLLAEKVKTQYYLIAGESDNFSIHPSMIFDADDVEYFLYYATKYHDEIKHQQEICKQSNRMLVEVIYYLNSYYL